MPPQAQSKIMIFVGPQVRDGFIDMDSGIADSIKDIREELRTSGLFTVVAQPADAKILLTIVARRLSGDAGAVGIPIGGGMTVAAPQSFRVIDSILRVGDYQKPTTSGDDHAGLWRGAAKQVVKDITAWVEANRDRLGK